MLGWTKVVAQKVRSIPREDYELRASMMKNMYKGRTMYLISCGPSISEVWCPELRQFLSDKLVVGVKQAQELAPEIFDIHCFNHVRIQGYRHHPDTIVMSVYHPYWNRGTDVYFPLVHRARHNESRWQKSLMVSKNWVDGEIEVNYPRPWGPGIVLELCIYLPTFFGCSELVIFGWDMNENDMQHFYKKDLFKRTGKAHYNNVLRECRTLPGAIPSLLEWWRSRGVKRVRLCSPRSALPIPQASVEEVLCG